MSARSITLRGRTTSERNMVDACTITRPAGAPVWDDATGTYTQAPPTTVYTGKCRVQMPQAQNRNPAAGDVEWTVQAFEVQVPMSAVGVHVDDTVTVTASDLDSDLVGRVFKVVSLAHKTHMTSRRLACDEVTG